MKITGHFSSGVGLGWLSRVKGPCSFSSNLFFFFFLLTTQKGFFILSYIFIEYYFTFFYYFISKIVSIVHISRLFYLLLSSHFCSLFYLHIFSLKSINAIWSITSIFKESSQNHWKFPPGFYLQLLIQLHVSPRIAYLSLSRDFGTQILLPSKSPHIFLVCLSILNLLNFFHQNPKHFS
jgi:hypothetical protein